VWEETHRVEFLNPLAGAAGDAAEAGPSCDVNGNCS
jgi:predicted dithiol-disulfide isomerase involved in polyketide biosynthesis